MQVSEQILLLQELNNTIVLVEKSEYISREEKSFIIKTVIKNIGHLLTTEGEIYGK